VAKQRYSTASRRWSHRAVGVIAAGLAVVYPSFGMTLVVVLIAEAILAARRKRVTQPSD
jgi:uncharacterized iron-regulated membrane protein